MKPATIILSLVIFFPLEGFSEIRKEKSKDGISSKINGELLVDKINRIIGSWQSVESKNTKPNQAIEKPLDIHITFLKDGSVIMHHQEKGAKRKNIVTGEFSVSKSFITIYGHDPKRGWRYSEHYKYTLKDDVLELTTNSEHPSIIKLKKQNRVGGRF